MDSDNRSVDSEGNVRYNTIVVNSDSEALMYSDVVTSGGIYARNITNVDWLSNLTIVGPYSDSYLDLSNNQLTNVDGLSSLTRVGHNGIGFNLGYNQLTNVDGLSSFSAGRIYLNNNQLTRFDFPAWTGSVFFGFGGGLSTAFASSANYDSISIFANRIFTDSNGYTINGSAVLEQMGLAYLLDNTDIIISAANEVF